MTLPSPPSCAEALRHRTQPCRRVVPAPHPPSEGCSSFTRNWGHSSCRAETRLAAPCRSHHRRPSRVPTHAHPQPRPGPKAHSHRPPAQRAAPTIARAIFLGSSRCGRTRSTPPAPPRMRACSPSCARHCAVSASAVSPGTGRMISPAMRNCCVPIVPRWRCRSARAHPPQPHRAKGLDACRQNWGV